MLSFRACTHKFVDRMSAFWGKPDSMCSVRAFQLLTQVVSKRPDGVAQAVGYAPLRSPLTRRPRVERLQSLIRASSRVAYTLIAAMSGRVPMMFITRVRL
jgi:hypothetical protein